jgi:hypothetical protein
MLLVTMANAPRNDIYKRIGQTVEERIIPIVLQMVDGVMPLTKKDAAIAKKGH